ncbi:phage portal protein [Micromonospora endolithica]|uniref:Phage portal protein n=1 Tax=Micromonospora endolithica TaxID=230091 RepID=A0A3A9YRM2_9ACTN|nr:phage portal protein [Micromonospora endolithica]RKN38459.1 phage portal protein [Micromonospora endolithica]TWJ23121.1 HK97 family phage portal protein [Micromonospora endolithica]
MTLFNSARAVVRASIESPAVPLTSTTLLDWLGGPKVHAGVAVTEQGSLGMPAVWRAVNLIAGTSASLPLHAYRYDDDVRVKVSSGSQAARLLVAPHPDMTPFELWEQVFAHLLLWGNAYLRILRNRLGQIVELWLIHPGRVRAGRESETGTKVYLIDGDIDAEYTDDKILHIPGFGYDGVCGVSPIRAARQGIGLALAAEEYGARLFGNGSLASGILQTEQRLEPAQADALKARWRAKVGGLDKAHEVAVLDSGIKFQQMSIPPEDAQFIESRKFQIDEVARMFGIPPHMLMQTEKSTSWGTGIEQQVLGFVKFTLRPWLTRVEQRVTKLLTPQSVYARYSLEGLLRGDSAQRAAFYTQMWNLGAYSTNDIRRLEDMPPVDGGDVRYRPLNMGELGQPDPVQTNEEATADA